MKILVNARFLQTRNMEGIGLYSYEILRRLAVKHPDDQFIFCFDGPYSKEFIFGNNVIPAVVRPPARHAILFWWWYHVALPRLYQKHDADLLFSPDGFTPTSAAVDKVLVTIHDLAYKHYPNQISFSNRWYYRRFMPQYIEKADHIITVSNSSKQDICTSFPKACDKITTIYNGVRKIIKPLSDQQKHDIRHEATNGTPYFVSVGALHPRKNIERLIKAFGRFRVQSKKDMKLLIIGRRAWQTQRIDHAIQGSDVREDIKVLDYVSDDRLVELLSAAQALCYVSLFEGFGLPILEAMQADVPVITSNRSSMAEIAQDAACLVNPESIEGIAQAMQRMLDQKYAQLLVQKGRERLKVFDWETAADAHMQIINEFR